ncbi:MAG: pentapeptide repeat-containing protein [Rhodospirillales bacterium]
MINESAKRKANENPWYLLATYYGEQSGDDIDYGLHNKNRIIWNRWMSGFLAKERRDAYFADGFLSQEEINFLGKEDRISLWSDGRSPFISAPNPNEKIDLRNTLFLHHVHFEGFLFLSEIDIGNSVFEKSTSFANSEFLSDAVFVNSVFARFADFSKIKFYGSVGFQRSKFGDVSQFSDTNFYKSVNMKSVTFHDIIYTVRTKFEKNVYFRHSKFLSDSCFSHISVENEIDFEDCEFIGELEMIESNVKGSFSLNNVVARDDVTLVQSVFSGMLDLSNSIFFSKIDLSLCMFLSEINMINSRVYGRASFRGGSSSQLGERHKQFSGVIDISESIFFDRADFSNREFLDSTSFYNAKFVNHVPEFADTKLHEGTVWHGVEWPKTPRHSMQALEMADSYSHLRRRSNAIQDHEAEIDFFGRELRAKRAWKGGVSGLLITMYELSCSFGQSIIRPILWLLFLFGAMPPIYHLVIQYTWDVSVDVASMYMFSFKSLFGLLGFRRDISGQWFEELSLLIQVLSYFQTMLGGVFVFLLGLSLRNRFRIK